jgi:hypothetical protein
LHFHDQIIEAVLNILLLKSDEGIMKLRQNIVFSKTSAGQKKENHMKILSYAFISILSLVFIPMQSAHSIEGALCEKHSECDPGERCGLFSGRCKSIKAVEPKASRELNTTSTSKKIIPTNNDIKKAN